MNKLSRREFLKLAESASIGLALSACGVSPTTTVNPTSTDLPTSTSIPTASPTIPPTPTSTSSPEPTSTTEPSQTPSPTPDISTLRGLADRLGMEIGVLLAPDEEWTLALQSREFNFGAFDGAWKRFESTPGTFARFGFSNDQNQFAVENRMKTRYYHLFDGLDCPQWLVEGNFSKSEITGFMKRWVNAAVEHFETNFPGVVTQYNVVNEVWTPDRDDFLYQVFGYDYIKLAFIAAREATAMISPPPKLLYSDTKNHATDSFNGVNTELTAKHVAMLRAEKLVDGVACQVHTNAKYPPDKADMLKTFQAYGLPVYITECDVSLNKIDGSTEERYQLQADIYRAIFEAAIESGVCNSITFWGAGYSWLEQPEFKDHFSGGPNADPTLWDHQLQPKPAFYAVRDVLTAALSARS